MHAWSAGMTMLVAGLDQPLEHDPGELRSRASDLLSRPPYTETDPGLLGRAVQWVGETLARALQIFVDGVAATGAAGAWAIAVVGLVLLGLVVWRLTRGSTIDRRMPEVPSTTPARSASSWRSEAQAHEAAGRLGDAVRCWYTTLVVGLIEQGMIEEVPGRTVRELNVEVRRVAPALHESVVAAGDRFETVVYGGREPTAEAIGVVRDAVDAVTGVRA